MEIIASTLVYVGLLAMLAGLVNVMRPLRVLRVRRRRTGALVTAAGALLVAGAMALPARAHQAAGPATQLDVFFPAWEFAERHTTRVHASPERTYRAIHAVTADEILFFRTLIWMRNPTRAWKDQRASILAPPENRPLLDVAVSTTFLSLADVPQREVLVGTVVCCGRVRRPGNPEAFAALTQPGFAKAGMNFVLQDEGGGWTRVTTETRVHGTDPVAQRRFARYWRVIYPGSALIRRGWLRAIKLRAEAGTAGA